MIHSGCCWIYVFTLSWKIFFTLLLSNVKISWSSGSITFFWTSLKSGTRNSAGMVISSSGIRFCLSLGVSESSTQNFVYMHIHCTYKRTFRHSYNHTVTGEALNLSSLWCVHVAIQLITTICISQEKDYSANEVIPSPLEESSVPLEKLQALLEVLSSLLLISLKEIPVN